LKSFSHLFKWGFTNLYSLYPSYILGNSII
jgi:hypothetical protein